MRNSKTIMIKKNKTTSAGLKNLKRKKKYYIEICGYKKVKVGKQYKNELGTVTKKTIKTKIATSIPYVLQIAKRVLSIYNKERTRFHLCKKT